MLALVYALSSIPDLDDAFQGPVFQLVANAMHAPLFGAIAFCCYKTVSASRRASVAALVVAFVASATYGALDEWHQSFVAGRDASLSDLFVDIVGITAVLLVIGVRSARETARGRTRDRLTSGQSKRPGDTQVG